MTYTHTAGTPVTDPIGTRIEIDGEFFTIGPETDAFGFPLSEYDYEVTTYARELVSYELSSGYAIRVKVQALGNFVDIVGDDGITTQHLLEMSLEDFRGMAKHFSEV